MKIPERAKSCPACNGSSMAIGVALNRAGATVYPFFCLDCGQVTQQYASARSVRDFAAENGPLRRVYTKTELRIASGEDDVGLVQHCEVCDSTESLERHHWAPFHLFGDESDRWPTSLLCRPCHVRWHQIVTPNMGKPRP